MCIVPVRVDVYVYVYMYVYVNTTHYLVCRTLLSFATVFELLLTDLSLQPDPY